jgi:hypothetical protein
MQQNGAVREADVRVALGVLIKREHSAEEDTRVIPELDLCQASARIDLAVVNGRMIGWEIKSAQDTLARLPRQSEVYSRIFDRVWLVAAPRHIGPAMDTLPPWWGVMEATTDGSPGACRLRVIRPSRLNRGVDPGSLVRLLWRDEVLDELRRLGLVQGLERAPRRELWCALAAATPRRISVAQLRARVRERLKIREGWRSGEPRK